MMDLLIENGILLKPYIRAWTPDGWSPAPAGWTPDRGPEVQARADELGGADPALPREFLLQAAEKEIGKRLYEAKKPWPGWVPITAQEDPKTSRTYRELFERMNEDDSLTLTRKGGAWYYPKSACWPPDGHYRLRGGRMERVENA